MKESDPYYKRIAEDPYYRRFVNPSWSRSSVYRAESVFRTYLQFYEEVKGLTLTPGDLLKRLEEDRKKPPLERGLIEQEWLEFIAWLQTTFTKRRKGANKRLAPKTIRDYGNVTRQFYTEFGYVLSSKATLPLQIRRDRYGRKENRKINIRAKDVKNLLNVMKSNRDKALTLALFQSGMDPSTTFSLRYGDIQKEFEGGTVPLVMNVKRSKTSVSHRACLGRDALKALKVYLTERTAPRWKCELCEASWGVKRNTCPYCSKKRVTDHKITEYREDLTPDSFLFIAKNLNKEMAIGNFDQRFRRYGVLAGLVTEDQLKKADKNPARPYALRSAFSSILGLKGMDRDYIEYLMGHSVPYNGAYLGMSDDELRELYQQYEEHLSVSEVRELEDVRKEFEGKMKKQQYLIEGMEKRLNETESQLKNLSQSLVGRGEIEEKEAAQKILSAILTNPDLLEKLGEEMKKRK